MSFFEDVAANFLSLICAVLSLFSLIAAFIYWLGGYFMPWSIIFFVGFLLLLAMARAFSKRG